VAGNLAPVTNLDTFLDLNKCADFYVVSNFTTIEIREIANTDILPQFYVGSDSLTRWLKR